MLDTVDARRSSPVRPRWARLLLRPLAWIDAGQLAGILLVFVVSRAAWMLVFQLTPGGLVDALCQWDCKWYMGIAQNGYDLEPHFDSFQADWAFFPAYPLLVWLLSAASGLSVLIAGTIVSNVAIIAGVWIGCRYLERTRPEQGRAIFVLLALAGPYSFYFSTVYSEALFFLLVSASFWFWVSDRPILSGLSSALLSATRAVGVFIAFGFALDLLIREGRRAPRRLLERPELLVSLLLAPVGLGAFMLYLYWHVGDALAFSHVQVAWGREFVFPLIWLAAGLLHYDLPNLLDPDSYSYFYSSCWAVLAIPLLVWLARRRRWPEFSFALLCLLVPLSAGLISIPRFVAGCPVFLFAVTDLLSRARPKGVGLVVAGILSLANLVLLGAWFNGSMSFI